MFESSKDILFIVLSFCIIWVTVFLCWMFYYAGKILKNASQIVEEFRVRLQVLTEAVNYIRGKVENISSLITLATSGAAGLVKKVVNRKVDEWSNRGAETVNDAAKDAVAAAAKKMKKMAKAIKK